MIQIDLSQYPTTVRNDLCMALYRMTERHNPRPEADQATAKTDRPCNHQPEGCGK